MALRPLRARDAALVAQGCLHRWLAATAQHPAAVASLLPASLPAADRALVVRFIERKARRIARRLPDPLEAR